MEEQLISFETAKLAKEKGFTEIVKSYFHPNYGLVKTGSDEDNFNRDTWSDGYYSAPTQSLLQKWLREEHKIHIEIQMDDEDEWGTCLNILNDSYESGYWTYNHISYEVALEYSIKQALTLISTP